MIEGEWYEEEGEKGNCFQHVIFKREERTENFGGNEKEVGGWIEQDEERKGKDIDERDQDKKEKVGIFTGRNGEKSSI